MLGDLLLTDGYTGPRDPHVGDPVNIVLVELDLQSAVVTFRPLSQTPLLHDQRRLLQLHVLAADVAVEDRELASNMRALKLTGRATGERSNTLRVCERGVQLLRSGAELVRSVQSCRVYRHLTSTGGGSLRRLRSSSLLRLRDVGRSRESAGWVGAGRMLKVLAMLSDQSRPKLGKRRSQLGDNLRTNEILHRLLGRRLGIDVDVELFNNAT